MRTKLKTDERHTSAVPYSPKEVPKFLLWFVKQFYLWLLTAMGGGRTEEFIYQQVQDFLSVTGGQSILSVNTITVGKSVDDNERKMGKGS